MRICRESLLTKSSRIILSSRKGGDCALFLPSGEDGCGQSPLMGQGTSPLWGLGQRPKVLKTLISAIFEVHEPIFLTQFFHRLFDTTYFSFFSSSMHTCSGYFFPAAIVSPSCIHDHLLYPELPAGKGAIGSFLPHLHCRQ